MAHIAIFRRRFVEKDGLLTDTDYASLVALCQVIPGPASSQVGMALGYRLGGLVGALLAWVGFTLPSAVLMGIGAYLWLSGEFVELGWVIVALKLVALGIVTQAVIGMWQSLCVEHSAKVIALIAAVLFYIEPTAWVQLGMIVAALVAGDIKARQATSESFQVKTQSLSLGLGCVAVVVIGVALSALLPSESGLWHIMSGHFVSGALVFGGGHVVLPLLQAEFVPPLSEAGFLAGYGLAQAMPGPLFTLASYLGGLGWVEAPWLGALVATLAIFIPGALLLAGAALVGHSLLPWLKARILWVNAVVVGLLASVLVNPIFTESVTSEVTTGLGMLSLLIAVVLKRSPLELVGAMLIATFGVAQVGWL